MKDSGIEWLGSIPNTWRIERLQWHLSEINISNNPIKTEQVLSLTNKLGVVPYEEKGNQGNKAKENYSEYKLAYPNTIVANSMNVIIGSVGISDYFGCVSPVYYVFKPNEKENIAFINYVFQTVGFQKELRKYANGILEIRLRVSADGILKRSMPYPPLEEQERISSYLTHKCAEIDALSADIQTQIDMLEQYKQSLITELVFEGIEKKSLTASDEVPWIKGIPQGWKISKIKYEVIPLNRNVNVDDEVITCFRDGQVTLRKNRREDGYTVSFTEDGYQGVNEGDLVIHGMDTFAGAIGCSDSRGKCSPVVHVCKTSGNNRYFMYCLRSMAKNDVLWFYANGVRIRSSDFRNFSNLGRFNILVPPKKEQDAIVEFLDDKCENIDATIIFKKSQISVLEECKKSLIYEYVTGKKEVAV
jgi:type I restriction enzyme S subunit